MSPSTSQFPRKSISARGISTTRIAGRPLSLVSAVPSSSTSTVPAPMNDACAHPDPNWYRPLTRYPPSTRRAVPTGPSIPAWMPFSPAANIAVAASAPV